VRLDDVVPLGVKLTAVEVQGLHLGVWDPDLRRVGALVKAGVDLEPAGVRGPGDQVDDRLERHQRLAAPVHRDEREQAVLNLVPLGSPWWEVADLELKLGVIGELL